MHANACLVPIHESGGPRQRRQRPEPDVDARAQEALPPRQGRVAPQPGAGGAGQVGPIPVGSCTIGEPFDWTNPLNPTGDYSNTMTLTPVRRDTFSDNGTVVGLGTETCGQEAAATSLLKDGEAR